MKNRPLIVALASLCIAAIACGTTDTTENQPLFDEPAGAEVTETPQESDVPTITTGPTATPIPPTETPSPTPLPDPVTLEGNQPDVTDVVSLPTGIYRVVASYTGVGNFIVWSYGEDGSEDLLFNDLGNYEGEALLPIESDLRFEVTASGPWTLTVEPIPVTDSYAGGLLEGQGDRVSDLFQPDVTGNRVYGYSHDGQSNFIVLLYCAGDSFPEYVVNEIGIVEGETIVNVASGPCLWEVTADGTWLLNPEE